MATNLFQGWNCRRPANFRGVLLEIGNEESADGEMPSRMIAGLLGQSPVET